MDQEQRCADARRVSAIDAAVRAGDMAALVEAVGDPDLVPNGVMPLAIGPLLAYAVYHAPLPFIAALIERGAHVNPPAPDGFPPLIAALTCAASQPGSPARPDYLDIMRLLLAAGSDPNQRGINDWTPLHAAIAYDGLDAMPLLLDAGADPSLRTRIDDYETAAEMASAAGLGDIADLLRARETDS